MAAARRAADGGGLLRRGGAPAAMGGGGWAWEDQCELEKLAAGSVGHEEVRKRELHGSLEGGGGHGGRRRL